MKLSVLGIWTIWRGLVWIFSHETIRAGYRDIQADGRSEYGQFDEKEALGL